MRSGTLWIGLAAGLVGLVSGASAVSPFAAPAQPDAKPARPATHIVTRWAKDVSQEAPWPEYPRPTMVRGRWQSLNGVWDCCVVAGGKPTDTEKWDKILVPFPIESALSGLQKRVGAKDTLHYMRTFEVPADWRNSPVDSDGDGIPDAPNPTSGAVTTVPHRVMLHFGAVDWHARVKVNNTLVGEHKGGYDPFSFDITDALKEGKNQLVVEVVDPTDEGGQPRGKQWARPHGIWYTPTTGIWQTVWIEPVPVRSISSLRADTSMNGRVTLHVGDSREDPQNFLMYEAVVSMGGKPVLTTRSQTKEMSFDIPNPTLWSPEAPALYDVTVRTYLGQRKLDEVKGYFGIREVKMAKDSSGINRLMLNGKPIFMFGPLDQGFWPDGIYTPPTEEAMKFDIEAVKKMGANMLRKHVKVENERFYYWCDKMGVMVWQDIPSPFFKSGDPKPTDEGYVQPRLTAEWKQNFEKEARAIIEANREHPSIVMWLPWNEGWGQNDIEWSKSVVETIKKWDPSRLVNCATGWTDMGNGDVLDHHLYPGPGMPPVQKDRAVVLGEYGGLGLPLKGHTWEENDKNWGYVTYKNTEELTAAYVSQIRQMPLLIGEGLCAAVYTQTTDVEIECNGWLTYDREVWKIDPVKASEASKAMFLPPPKVKVVVARVGQGSEAVKPGEEWFYTLKKPADDSWMKPLWNVNLSEWKKGAAGFGTKGTPGATIGTEWSTNDIWIRRGAAIAGPMKDPMLSIHHDEDAEVYINGELAAKLPGYTTGYQTVPVTGKAAEILKGIPAGGGVIVISVHCHQTGGGQYIDVGLVELER